MFWDNFLSLCTAQNIKPNTVCKELGFSNAASTHWKNGTLPNTEALLKISQYFDVSVDYLLGRSDNINLSNITSSVVNSGTNNSISNCNNSGSPTNSDPINDKEVWEIYEQLSVKDKLEVKLDIINRGNK